MDFGRKSFEVFMIKTEREREREKERETSIARTENDRKRSC
jgi:hypothetical protein